MTFILLLTNVNFILVIIFLLCRLGLQNPKGCCSHYSERCVLENVCTAYLYNMSYTFSIATCAYVFQIKGYFFMFFTFQLCFFYSIQIYFIITELIFIQQVSMESFVFLLSNLLFLSLVFSLTFRDFAKFNSVKSILISFCGTSYKYTAGQRLLSGPTNCILSGTF